jgi:transcriptional regulator GlxA family with amidase domain
MRLRIEHAKRLLVTTDDSQERIASACGFYNASHLSAAFLRCVGIRPSVFRSNL